MQLFRRGDVSDQELGPLEAADAKSEGKGRPTPTRREAEAARKQTVSVPRDPKEARRAQKERARTERTTARAGLMAGDERYLPPRDAGPVRAYVRNYVDARLTAGEFFIPVAVGVLVLGFIPALAQGLVFIWLLMLIFVVLDCTLLWWRLRRDLPAKFPDDEHKGAVPYAIMRSLQLRSLRLPKPKVRLGGKPK